MNDERKKKCVAQLDTIGEEVALPEKGPVIPRDEKWSWWEECRFISPEGGYPHQAGNQSFHGLLSIVLDYHYDLG